MHPLVPNAPPWGRGTSGHLYPQYSRFPITRQARNDRQGEFSDKIGRREGRSRRAWPMPTLRFFLGGLLGVSLGLLPAAGAREPARQPNVLLIIPDQLRAQALGC